MTAAPPPDDLLADLRLAAISRALDDKEIALQKQNRVFFQISGAGHEALYLGLARSLRAGHDWFFPYYRDRSLVLGLGIDPPTILLQAVGAADDPASGGRQMPCHFGDPSLHIVSQSSATGSQILPAVGCAEAGRYLRTHPGVERAGRVAAEDDEITYVSIGEGATSQGEFWEGLNTASRLGLLVLFVVADNGWAISVPARDQQPAPVSDLVSGFAGLQVERVDGTDYAAVHELGRKVVDQIRGGGGPVLLHATVTRPYSHSAADTQSKYRTPDDLAAEQARDPLTRMSRLAIELGLLSDEQVTDLVADARREVDAAAREAMGHPPPDPSTATRHVVALPDWPEATAPPSGDDELVTMADGIRRCLHELMSSDERIRVFGEDVADAPAEHVAELEGKGGVFGTTHGLQAAFGDDRCFNSPLAEANIVGRAVGQAIRGLRPFPEVQFHDYVWTATQQIRTEAATLRWRSNGAFSAPLVLRIPIGGYLTGGAIWHSQSGESIWAHTPGLLIAMPSRAADAVGLLRAAMTCDDPVLFLEHKHLYRQPTARDPYPPEGWILPFGVAARRRQGDDLTIVTWGATVQRSIDAADQIATETGAQTEVLDLRTIAPWDRQAVVDSVSRTGRLLVVHEDVRTAGFGAEVAALVAEECFDDLRAPIRRVAALDTFVGYSPALEDVILPQTADIADAIAEMCS